MKKLTAGIFAGILTVVGATAANADLASDKWVEGYVGKQVATINTNIDKKVDQDVYATHLTAQSETDTKQTADIATNTSNIATNTSNIAANSKAITDETNARATADTAINTALGAWAQDAELSQSNVTAEIKSLKANSLTESNVSELRTAVTNNTSNISANALSISENAAEIAAEKSAREQADTTLEGKITAETTARGEAVTALQAKDTELAGAIETEENTRSAKDTELEGKITALQGVQADYQTKANIVTAIDLTNTGSTEKYTSIAAVEGAVSAEKTARDTAISEAKTELEGKITAEATARGTAISEAKTELEGKITANTNAINALDTTYVSETELTTHKTEQKAIDDAQDVKINANASAIETINNETTGILAQAKTETTTQVTALANGQVATNTAAIATNKTATETNATAIAAATEKLNFALLNPGKCANPGWKCALTLGTNGALAWEVIQRGTDELPSNETPQGYVQPSIDAIKTANGVTAQ